MLNKKIALITGASRGIGREIALAFARNNANLGLIALNDSIELKSVCEEIKKISTISPLLFHGDISCNLFCSESINTILEKYHKIDILVNCAGIITREKIEELNPLVWQRVLDVNLNAPFYLSKLCLPHMRSSKYGRIINITSQMAFIPHPSASPSYEVSKAGLSALTRHLALAYAKDGITVNSIAPGSIDTDLPKSMPLEWREAIKAKIPMGRLGNVSEIASAALFLASPMSSYITGSTIHVNGGSLMR